MRSSHLIVVCFVFFSLSFLRMRASRQPFLNLFCILWLLLLLKAASCSPLPSGEDSPPPLLPSGLYKGHTCVGMYAGSVCPAGYFICYCTSERSTAVHVVNHSFICSYSCTAKYPKPLAKLSLKMLQGQRGVWIYFMILFLSGCFPKFTFFCSTGNGV